MHRMLSLAFALLGAGLAMFALTAPADAARSKQRSLSGGTVAKLPKTGLGQLPQAPAGEKAIVTKSGLAVAPASAPPEIQRLIAAGNKIAKKPYKYGGGHGRWRDTGYDCSGSVSYVLHAAGLLSTALDSGSFARWGKKGRGTWITIRTNPGHAYLIVAGIRFDTSAFKSGGSRWTTEMRSPGGFVARHPALF